MDVEKLSLLGKRGHSTVNILCIVVLSILFVLVAIFNGFAGSGNTSFFYSKTGEIAIKYEMDVTPAGWTFSIWVI